ncbi:hypothetical protein Terro_0498 [Terriglobus roseus DSM 18391]|uniref:Uncharacterized protein n=1 Tax=Terriglobus roseus (strain DSM 18391 / NRRL B-41598 / KBS 63) TaxID=926566 RepID=I3ZC71_TERRK|nr:hypothetical protein Terro_0498 [Terriglobus roseus DSM 18391]
MLQEAFKPDHFPQCDIDPLTAPGIVLNALFRSYDSVARCTVKAACS